MLKSIVSLFFVLFVIMQTSMMEYVNSSGNRTTLSVCIERQFAVSTADNNMQRITTNFTHSDLFYDECRRDSRYCVPSLIGVVCNDDNKKESAVATDSSTITIDDNRLQQRTYSFTTKEEANEEIINPKPTPIPSNELVTERFRAIAPFDSTSRHASTYYWRFRLTYNFFLNSTRPLFNSKGELDVNRTTLPVRELSNKDLEQLAWTISLPSKVELGTPTQLWVGIKNISDRDVRVTCSESDLSFFFLNSIMIRKVDDGQVVFLTKTGVRNYYDLKKSTSTNLFPVVTLKPGETFDLPYESFDLLENYVLTEPGEYELTFFTRQYCDEAERPLANMAREYPRKATVRFTVLPKHIDNESSVK